MNRRLLVTIVAGLAVAALATWFFALRDPGGRKEGRRMATGADPWAAAPREATRPEAGGPGRGGGDPLEVRVDDDPKGDERLEGVVMTADEHPVAGATVSLSSNPPRTATTDTDGSFAFDTLTRRPYTLVARATGGVAGPLTVQPGSAAKLVVLTLRPAAAVKVTVVDGKNRPIGGAEVELRGLDRQAATAGADGVARFATVVPGGYDVMARASAGLAPAHAFRMVPPGEIELTLALRPGAAVSGRVVDSDGKPVVGATVLYSGASDWGARPDERLDGQLTGADGAWRFDALAAGSYRFVARDGVHAPGSSALVSVDGVTAKDGVEVVMAAGATVRGTVVDGQRQPVPAARVRIGDAGRNMVGEPPRQVFTEDDGTFVLRGLPRKAMAAVAMSETAASATVPVDTTAGDVTGLVLTVELTGVIAGTVVDRAGEPIDGVQVSAMPDFRGGNFEPGQFRLRGLVQDLTDPDGHFELVGLAEGTYLVRAVRGAGARGRMFGMDGESAKTGTRDLRIVLPADGGVKGKVAFADGTAPVAFTVSAGFMQDQGGGKDGAFELTDVAPGNQRLTVRGGDFDDKTVEVKVEEGKVTDAGTITVTRGRRIGGVVLFQGQPLAGATVYAGSQIFGSGSSNEAPMGGPPRGQTRTATTGEDGRWSMSGLGPTALAVVAEHPEHGRSPARRLGRVAPDEQQLQLVVAGFGALTGTVTDGAGPAEGRIVTVTSTSTPNAMWSVITGPDGGYRLDKLGPDTYKVSAMIGMPFGRGGMQLQSKIGTVASGGEARVDLTVQKGPLSVTVAAAPGPAAGVTSEQVRGVAWLLPATLTGRTVEELQLAGGADPGTATFTIMMGGQAVFNDLSPGPVNACIAALPREATGGGPMAGQEYFQRHADTLPVHCKQVVLAAQPTQVRVEIPVELPPFDPS